MFALAGDVMFTRKGVDLPNGVEFEFRDFDCFVEAQFFHIRREGRIRSSLGVAA